MPPETDSIVDKIAAGRRKRNVPRVPVTMAALFIGTNGRSASDMPDLCALVQKASKVLEANIEMEQTNG